MFSISRFEQLLKNLPRAHVQRLADKYKTDRYTKGFDTWSLLIAQVYGQLSGSRSLRELETGYNLHARHHYHLGTGPVRRTTLADACAKRKPQVFEELVGELMSAAHRKIRRQVREGLLLLDSTSLTLKGRGFDWAKEHSTRNTQGLKLHVVFNQGSATPVVQEITQANVNDVTQAVGIQLQAGATYVFDKGYCDYNWWSTFESKQALFVTRLKSNAAVKVLEQKDVAAADQQHILADELIAFSNRTPGGKRRNQYIKPLRRVRVHRPDHDSDLVLVTNDMNRSGAEIAACYKARWNIELFFKWIKQNLRLKAFYGRSRNAVRIQLLCALIAYLLVALYCQAQSGGTSLLRVFNALRAGLFQRPRNDEEVERRRRENAQARSMIQPDLFT